jgi:hypothetical protein
MNDKEFIRIVENPSDSCYMPLYNSTTARPEIIRRLDDLVQALDIIEYDKSYASAAGYFGAEVKQIVDHLDGIEKRKEGKEERWKMDSILKNQKTGLIQALMIFTDLHSGTNQSKVADYISYIRNTETLQKLYFEYEHYFEFHKIEDHPITPNQLEKNLISIADRLDKLEAKKFSMYQSNSSTFQKVKGIDLYHENDVFMGGGKLGSNQDREMTGAFKFEVNTDYFKFRYLNLGWIFNGLVIGRHKNDPKRIYKIKHPQSEVLSYQSLSFGGFGYTPYVRYRNNFALADTLHQHDRPFGSYVFVERSKYRLWPNGLVRHQGQFQIGQIGLLAGDKIQAKIHQDITTSSQRVYGWTKQVGNGGRYLLQLNHKADFLLFSTTNKYASVFTPKRPSQLRAKKKHRERGIYNQTWGDLKHKYAGVNIIGTADIRFGGYQTSFGAGVRFSTLDFINSTNQKYIVQRRRNRFDFGWHFDLGINYRYVQHNTMLEGLGYWSSFTKDPYDEDNPDYYVLQSSQVNRHLWIIDWGVTFRWRQMTMYYRQSFNRMEYTVPEIDYNDASVLSLVDPADLEFYQESIVNEHQSLQNRKFYGFGTIGASWIIQ